jgi:hypothetical protein
MVVHEHVGLEHDARHLQMVRQLAAEPLAVVVSPEDLRSAVAAAGNMIDGVRKIDPWRARHVARILSTTANCKPYSTKRKPDPAPTCSDPGVVVVLCLQARQRHRQ